MKINDVVTFLDEIYPTAIASDFDQGKIGLSVGSKNIDLKNILLALDVTLNVVEEAIKKNCNLIITHHPFLFEPLTRIDFETEKAQILRKLFEHNISLFSMHTNLDVGINGVNDTLGLMLGLQGVVSSGLKDDFLRYGSIKPQPLNEFTTYVKEAFGLEGVKYVGDATRMISKVGIVGGSGGSIGEVNRCIDLGIDTLITGEIKLHVAQYAASVGLTLIEVNHGVEKHVLVPLGETLKKRFDGKFEVFLSEFETDPFKFA